jgi:glycerophosphoryl diester phosphodiesterase
MKIFSCLLLLAFPFRMEAQPLKYSVANAHSHNDYEQAIPFRMAYQAGFGSIEADIFLQDSGLYVAHDRTELQLRRKLEDEYLKPLRICLEKNRGNPYPDSTLSLQMLIDIKTEARETIAALVDLLRGYPELIHSGKIHWVITGNRPDPRNFPAYPSFILFDGELYRNYPEEAFEKICLMSDDFRRYSKWNGEGRLPPADEDTLRRAILKAHGRKLPVRFWDAPDRESAWKELIRLRVDYLNTDHIAALADFLNSGPSP